jgi:hypothetical protein
MGVSTRRRVPALALFAGAEPAADPRAGQARLWRVNGWPAQVVVWTEAEVLAMPAGERPSDAQRYPCGVWVALRLAGDGMTGAGRAEAR